MDQSEAEHVTAHAPVLLHEVLEGLAIAPSSIVVDCTAGGGGHAEAILRMLGSDGRYIGIDADSAALERVRKRIGSDPRVSLVLGNFRHVAEHCKRVSTLAPTHLLADLGFSSDQLEHSGRGFSLQRDEPLVMTFETTVTPETLTAWHVVNEWSEASLCDILRGFGGEPAARRIAQAIVEAREERPITTSHELAAIVEAAAPRGKRRIHPATRTFQALRMAVNDELGALEALLADGFELLAPAGRMAIISFHSLEDRTVKHAFRSYRERGVATLITKRPIIADLAEVRANPRSRSAKLRILEKKP